MVRTTWILVLCVGCGAGSASPDPPFTNPATKVVGNVGFRIDGATVDKVACGDSPSTKAAGCKSYASMDGGTLRVSLMLYTSSSGQLGTNFTIRAFDGSNRYVVDGAKDAGSFQYHSGKNDMYGEITFTIPQRDTAVCTFDIQSGPANPVAGNVVDGTFHCENLRADPWNVSAQNFVEQRVQLTNGVLHLVF